MLTPISPEALPAVAADAAARASQIEERAFWMGRDLRQSANTRENCNRLGELVALIERNNAGVED